jgi:hypothetical protein
MILHLLMPDATKLFCAIFIAFFTHGLVKFDYEGIFYKSSLFFLGLIPNSQLKKPNLYLYN